MNRAEEAPIRRVLLSDAVWLTAGQLLAAAALLVGTRLLSEFIPPEIFGQITLLLGVTTLATNFCSTPLIQGAIRFTPEYEIAGGMPTLRRTLNRPLRIVTFAFVLIVLAVGVILQRRAGSSTFAVIALCLLLIVDISRVRETSLLNAVGRQRLFSAWTAADAWVRLAAALLCVIFVRPSVESVLWGYFLGSGTIYLIFFLTSSESRGNGAHDSALQRRLIAYALPLVPAVAISWISGLSDRYIIAHFLTLTDVGIYSAAYALIGRPFLLASTILMNLVRPWYFRAIAAGDAHGERRWFRILIVMTASIGTLGLLAIIPLRRFIAHIALNERYWSGSELMPWIAAGHLCLGIAQAFNAANYGHGKTGRVTQSELVGAVASIAAGIPLIHRYGIFGAAWAVPVYYGAQLLAAIFLTHESRNGTITMGVK